MFQNLNTRSVTFNLIAINALVFFATWMIGDKMYELFSLFYPSSPYFKPVQLLTHMFMHGNLGHLFSNMFALFMFGTVLESVWGPQRYLFFYFVTGFGAMILHTLVQGWLLHSMTGYFVPSEEVLSQFPNAIALVNTPTVGASGAIFGILLAFGVLFPNTEMMLIFLPIPIKAKYFVALYVAWELYRGISMQQGDNVAHFAHLGGALFGFLLVKYWNRNRHTLY